MCGRWPTTASIVFILIGRSWRWRYRPTATSTATLFISTTSIWCAAWWIHFNFYCLELLALSSIWRRKKIFVNNKCEVMFWHNVIWLVSLRASFLSLCGQKLAHSSPSFYIIFFFIKSTLCLFVGVLDLLDYRACTIFGRFAIDFIPSRSCLLSPLRFIFKVVLFYVKIHNEMF